MAGTRYIIIGDGAAGTTAAETIRAADREATIAILSDDPHAAYYRAALTNFLLGELREEQIWAVPPSFYDQNAIQRAHVRVAKLDVERKYIWLASGGRPIPFDRLLIAAGARARTPTFAGNLLPGVMVMRTLVDVHRVLDLIKLRGLRSAVVCGGGPLAMEWAHGLVHRGVKVTMVVRDRVFLPGAIDNVASDLVLARLRQGGVDVRMGDEVTHALQGPNGHVAGVVLKASGQVACELVGVAFGVICNTEFLEGSPVKLAANKGILTDDRLQTSVPGICAAGDVAAVNGNLLQLWEPARHQARVAAGTLLGRDARYSPGVHYLATRLYDLDVASIGEVATKPADAEELVDFPQRTGQISYKKIYLRDNRVIGALLFGERAASVRRHGRAFKKMIDLKLDISSIKTELLDAAFDLSSWLRKRELTEKPKPAMQAVTMASGARMKGTNAINLADLPAPPASMGDIAKLNVPMAQDAGPSPVVRLEAAFGVIDVTVSSIIGRNPEVPVPLNDPDVSWTHAEITIEGQRVYVRDLGSATGTWVNGSPIAAAKRLKDGERIRVGSTELVVRIQSSAPPDTVQQLSPMSAQGDQRPHLDIVTGSSVGLSFELARPQEVIGRDPSCTIRLDDEWVDARHAWIRKTPTGWEVADAESAGVTKKNGQVLQPNQWVPFAPGDSIEVGAVRMQFTMRHALELAGFDYGSASAAPQFSMGLPGGAPQRPSAPPPRTASPGAPRPSAAPPAPGSYLPLPSQQRMSAPPASLARRGRLTVQRGPGAGSSAELTDVTVVGNLTGSASLVLPDPYLAPAHFEIARRHDGFYARDLGAPAGTTCRGQRLGPNPLRLSNGDIFILGPNVQLLFELAP